jgi:pentatricopeptide repeat protein
MSFRDRMPLIEKLLQPTKMPPTTKERKLAESVRKACLENLQRSYEEAGISGLCHEGRWEYALDVLRNLSMENLLKDYQSPATAEPSHPAACGLDVPLTGH